jgi:hypothetical protein
MHLLPLYLHFRVRVRLDTCPPERTMKKYNKLELASKEEKEKDRKNLRRFR